MAGSGHTDVADAKLEAFNPQEEDLDSDLHEYDPSAPRILRVIDGICEVMGVAAMLVVTGLIFVNALGRYLLSSPLNWADELVIALIPWLAMTGLFLSIRRGSVIRIEYFFNKLPARIQPAVTVFVTIVSAAALLQLAYYSFQYVSLFGRDLTPYLRLPRGYFTSAFLIGAGAAAIVFLFSSYSAIREARRGQGGA